VPPPRQPPQIVLAETQRLLEQPTMLCDDILVALAEPMLELRRSFDVREEEGDGPAGELAHSTNCHGRPYRVPTPR
jgi:hypothetical protein